MSYKEPWAMGKVCEESTFISKRSFILTFIQVDFLSKALHDQ